MGSSATMSTASSAARAPPGRSSTSNASSSAAAVSDSAVWSSVGHRLLGHASSSAAPSRASSASSVVSSVVEVVGHLDLALLGSRPPHGQLAQRRDLVERDRTLAEQLQQGEEPRDDDDRRARVGGERAERHRPAVPQPVDQHGGLLPDADGRGVQVADVDPGRRRLGLLAPSPPAPPAAPGRSARPARAAGRPGAARAATRRGNRRPSVANRSARSAATSLYARYCSSRAKSRSRASSSSRSSASSTSRGRQQPGGLEVEQGRGDDQELAGLAEVPLLLGAADVGDELVGDLRERDLGDVELVLGDQAEQQVERAAEVGEVDLERAACPDGRARTRRTARPTARAGPRARQAASPRATSSRAS